MRATLQRLPPDVHPASGERCSGARSPGLISAQTRHGGARLGAAASGIRFVSSRLQVGLGGWDPAHPAGPGDMAKLAVYCGVVLSIFDAV